jgi:Tfp pilus assembly protein PilN
MNVNLLPWREIRDKKNKKRVWIEVTLFFLFFCGYASIAHFSKQASLIEQKKEMTELESHVKKIKKNYLLAVKKQNQILVQKKMEDFLNNKWRVSQSILGIIYDFSDQMPDAIYLTKIVKEGGRIYFFGKSPSHEMMAKFLQKTKKQIKKQPIVTQTSQAEGQSGGINFEVGYGF